jgi:hypothetical protein
MCVLVHTCTTKIWFEELAYVIVGVAKSGI